MGECPPRVNDKFWKRNCEDDMDGDFHVFLILGMLPYFNSEGIYMYYVVIKQNYERRLKPLLYMKSQY